MKSVLRFITPGKQTVSAAMFLAPNLIGFIVFTLGPLLFSLGMAFTNWDLRLHNRFKSEPVQFVGLTNFRQLLDPAGGSGFWTYLGNSLFLMLGMPLAIAASLASAILLSQKLDGGGRRMLLGVTLTAVLMASTLLLCALGAGASANTLLVTGLFGAILVVGVFGRLTFYRTLFYLPNFTAGVATMILWKKLYQPGSGPINAVLAGPLDGLTAMVNGTPPFFWEGLAWVLLAAVPAISWFAARLLLARRRDGDVGSLSAAAAMAVVLLAAVFAATWVSPAGCRLVASGCVFAGMVFVVGACRRQDFRCPRWEGAFTVLPLAIALLILQLVLIGLSTATLRLPSRAEAGLEPPDWLTDYYWAKPALMLMGFWGAVGSNTMLMYLAALTNVPTELYEAAEIDGASRLAKFWNVTWPQLAPTTFFVVIMGVIGGIQGGFDAAKVLTDGGPAGSTTTLAYLIYAEGFGIGRLGYASAAAWTMFVLVLAMTALTWKVGHRHVND